MNKSTVLLAWLVLIGATALLLRDPHCGRGCRTLLEHLLTDEIDAAI